MFSRFHARSPIGLRNFSRVSVRWNRTPTKPSNGALRRPPAHPSASSPPPPPRVQARVNMFTGYFSKYGYSPFFIYAGLGVIDTLLFFAAIRYYGHDRVIDFQISVRDYFGLGRSKKQNEDEDDFGKLDIGITKSKDSEINDKDKPHESVTLTTEILLAYSLHRALFFVRIPLTLALTPPVVRYCKRLGYDFSRPQKVQIGKGSTGAQRFGGWFF